MSTRFLPALSLVVASAGFAAAYAAYAIWMMPLPDLNSRPIAEWSPDLVPLGDPANGQTKQNSFVQTFARPIFTPTRRPFVPKVAEAPAGEPAALPTPEPQSSASYDARQFSLRGILISGRTRRALIASPESPDGIWVGVGTEIMGWKVANVDQNGVKLEARGQSAEIKLYVDNSAN
jgi:hypothetical protein